MSDIKTNTNGQVEQSIFNLSAEEREHENALRDWFATFWSTASGDMRTIYDAFIENSPLVDGVVLEAVEEEMVQGWWVCPEKAQQPNQAILYLHGGGYVQGSAKAYRGFVSQIVSRTQIPALVIDYPLAPEATLPLAPNAALKAWRFLTEQGFKKIAIVGDSAGGGLTLVTLAALVQQSQGAPIAGVVFSPWTDLAFSGASMTDASVEDPLISHAYLQDCARKYLGATNASNSFASPLYGELEGLPPLLIQVGTDERLLDDSRQFAHRAAQAGVSVQLEIWEGMHHVFQLDVARLESSRIALDRAARFLIEAFTP